MAGFTVYFWIQNKVPFLTSSNLGIVKDKDSFKPFAELKSFFPWNPTEIWRTENKIEKDIGSAKVKTQEVDI